MYESDLASYSWWAHGNCVLDDLARTARSGEVRVRYSGTPPPLDVVRAIVGAPPRWPILMAPGPHEIVCTVDDIVVTSGGEVVNLSGNAVPSWPLEMALYQPDLGPSDVIRLSSMLAMFPDLRVSDVLRQRLHATLVHLREMAATFPDVSAAFVDHQPLSSQVAGVEG